jgi:rhamnose utilization protein RhaD (predicted bifunctional aldolase and dehydrogenase)
MAWGRGEAESAERPESAVAAELRTLVELSRTLGEPDRDLVILAEGNTSIRTGPDRMLVKASGSQLGTADDEDFVEVDIRAMLDLVNDETAGEDDVKRVFGDVGRGGKRPSVEAMLHAICLSVGGAAVVGHTHPVPVNIVLCSPHAERMSSDVLFPEQVVILGRTPVFVPYLDPGLTLARAVQQEMLRHLELDAAPPKVVYLGNHGIFALGESAAEVLQITAMAVKVSRILGGAIAVGGVCTLSEKDVARIDGRPDEIYRRQVLADTWQSVGRQADGPDTWQSAGRQADGSDA